MISIYFHGQKGIWIVVTVTTLSKDYGLDVILYVIKKNDNKQDKYPLEPVEKLQLPGKGREES